MNENITLPREVADYLMEVLEESPHHGDWSARDNVALAALRTALAAPRLEVTVDPRLTAEEAAAISAALAAEQPKPEPVAWMDRFGFVFRGKGPHETFTTPLYTAPPEDEALRRDAERYRWLRENAAGFSGKTLDAAIDAAMENKR